MIARSRRRCSGRAGRRSRSRGRAIAMLPSKIRPTTPLSRLTTGLPELPPMMSAVETKLSGVSSLSRPGVAGLEPARRQLVGVGVAVGIGVLEGPADRGVRGDRLAVDLVTLDRAEGQPERERGVGVDRVPLSSKVALAISGVLGGLDALDLVLAPLADGAGVGVDGAGELDHGVVATARSRLGLPRRAPCGPRRRRACVPSTRSRGGLLGRLAPQDALDHRSVARPSSVFQ